MPQMIISCSGHFRKFDAAGEWLIWSLFFLHSTYIICEKSEAHACSYTSTGSCNFFNISCNEGQRIQILEAKYISEEDRSAHIQINKCPAYPTECSDPLSCCPAPSPYKKSSIKNYSNLHFYLLLQDCSWDQICQAKAQYIDERSRFCSITYSCETEENTARFCISSNISASKLSMVFENSTDLKETDHAVCRCLIASTENFTVKTLDVRLQNAAGSCPENRAATLSGFQSDGNITCSEPFQHVNLQQQVSEMWLLLAIYSENKPQMVLIEASGKSDSTVTAQCFAPNQPFPTIETSTTPPRQNPTVPSVSSTLATPESSSASLTLTSTPTTKSYTSTKSYQSPTTLNHSTTLNIHANTSDTVTETSTGTFQNQTSSSHPDGLEVRANNSDDVPVAPIVVPIIFVLLSGAGIVFIIRRKRYTRNSETKFSKKYNAQTAVDNVVHNAAYLNTLVITGHNNNMQEAESTYTYIYHRDSFQFKGVQNHENGHKVTPQLTPECFAEEHVISPSSEQKFNNRDAEKRGTNNTNDTVNRNNNSAVYHSQNEGFLPSSSKINDYNGETSSHDYFVLEAQNLALNTSEYPDLNKPKNLDIIVREETQYPGYLELFPDDSYTGIDPADVNAQTLAENEYNTINPKKKFIPRDENYGALNFDMNSRNIHDTCEYSHFRISPFDKTKSDVNEYSQVRFDKARHDTSGNQKNKNDSSPRKTSAKTLIVNSEENEDYSHLKVKLDSLCTE